MTTKKGFLVAALNGDLDTVNQYLATKSGRKNLNTQVEFNPNFGISSHKRFSLSGLKGWYYKSFYYSDFNYYHDQSSVTQDSQTYHYVHIPSNVSWFRERYRYHMTALHLASEMGQGHIVRRLLHEKGINVNARDSNQCTPLILAAQFGHWHVVEQFRVCPQIDINATDRFGLSALVYAVIHGHKDVVTRLLKDPRINLKQLSLCTNQMLNVEQLALAYKKADIAQLIHARYVELYPKLTYQQRLDKVGSGIEIPLEFQCPISHDMMSDPITVSTGITYEREELRAYFNYANRDQIACPVTGYPLQRSELSNGANTNLKHLMEAFVVKHEEEKKARDAYPIRTRSQDLLAQSGNIHSFHNAKAAAELDDVSDVAVLDEDSYDTEEGYLVI